MKTFRPAVGWRVRKMIMNCGFRILGTYDWNKDQVIALRFPRWSEISSFPAGWVQLKLWEVTPIPTFFSWAYRVNNEKWESKIKRQDRRVSHSLFTSRTSQRWKRVKTELLELAPPRKATTESSFPALIFIKVAAQAWQITKPRASKFPSTWQRE